MHIISLFVCMYRIRRLPQSVPNSADLEKTEGFAPLDQCERWLDSPVHGACFACEENIVCDARSLFGGEPRCVAYILPKILCNNCYTLHSTASLNIHDFVRTVHIQLPRYLETQFFSRAIGSSVTALLCLRFYLLFGNKCLVTILLAHAW